MLLNFQKYVLNHLMLLIYLAKYLRKTIQRVWVLLISVLDSDNHQAQVSKYRLMERNMRKRSSTSLYY